MKARQRHSVYDSENIRVAFLSDSGESVDSPLKNFNSCGLGVMLEKSIIEDLTLKKEYSLKIKLPDYNFDTIAYLVHKSIDDQLVGFSTSLVKVNPVYKRNSERLATNSFMVPSGYLVHPFLMDERIYFRVFDVSPKSFGLIIHSVNSFLPPGITLAGKVVLPMVGAFEEHFTVKSVRVNEDEIRLGVEFPPNIELHQAISEYFQLVERGITPYDLRQMGFTGSVASGTDYVFATLDDLETIAALRKKTYSATKLQLLHLDPSDFIDKYDALARHLLYFKEGVVVASARVIPVLNGLKNSEVFNEFGIDPKTWSGEPFVEVSKLCVAETFQKSSLVKKLSLKCIKIAFDLQVKKIVCVSEDALLPIYGKMGFIPFAPKVVHPGHGVTLTPLVMDTDDALAKDFAKPLALLMAKRSGSN